MELDENGFLEELLGVRRETWENFPTGMNELLNYGGGLDSCQEDPSLVLPYSSLEGFATSSETAFNCSLNEVYCPLGEGLSINDLDLSSRRHDTVPFLIQEDRPSVVIDKNLSMPGESLHDAEEKQCKVEVNQETKNQAYDISACLGRKNRVKRLEGQPSKNLMAERRRRKRLNDRLSMLRSVVPKISKMDRTSILGDTINYMKELLDRIERAQEEIQVDADQMNLLSIYKELKPSEIQARNTPKFDVERRNTDTRLEICCAAKPGLLLSTVTTLEALGLEIQQCVISCFNDFGMQASCTEEMDQRSVVSSEEIKQALFRNAGYAGRCT